ncbi:MAG: type I secretion system permease/ATPase, partial [Novosphingobium sp.]
ILVLDEPTSSVDNENEARLMQRLKGEFAGRTLILITHRPSLLSLADRVIVMARGRVAMDGPTADVLRQVSRPRTVNAPQIAKG